jgi:cobyrinic acid a,c-diamide synthase
VKSSLNFCGVIFNRVASENHFKRLRESIIDMPVLGYLPRDLNFEIPHRHLGLATADEAPLSDETIERLADTVLRYIDVEKIMENGKKKMDKKTETGSGSSSIFHLSSPIRLAVARDMAFCFYYEDNLNLLRDAGAEIVLFSPLHDTELPDGIDGIYIGGGYPELYADQLSGNIRMRNAVKEWAVAGGPVYAECGGMMYLSKGIWKNEDERYDMAGIFPFKTVMKKRLARLGYREIKLNRRCIIGDAGARVRGHEFHYSEIQNSAHADSDGCYTVSNSDGKELQTEGYSSGNVLGSYIHLHFGSSRGLAGHMVNFMKKRGR